MIKLRSVNIYWNPDDENIKAIINDGEIKIKDMEAKDIEYLIKELDRRLIQLWDKVKYDRENGLYLAKKIVDAPRRT